MSAEQSPIVAFLDWLVAMDDPTSEEGMKARQTVTLTKIIDSARDLLRWIEVARTSNPAALGVLGEDSGPRLWEIDHPYYGYDEGHSEKVASFARLRKSVDGMDEDMNFVYRWDWKDWSQPHYDSLCLSPAEREEQEFCVYWLMPRKGRFGSLSCPISHDQEPEVRAWLAGPRVLGHLRKVWAPLLGETS